MLVSRNVRGCVGYGGGWFVLKCPENIMSPKPTAHTSFADFFCAHDFVLKSRYYVTVAEGTVVVLVVERWAPTNSKWSYTPYKWPYHWVTGVKNPHNWSYNPTYNW